MCAELCDPYAIGMQKVLSVVFEARLSMKPFQQIEGAIVIGRRAMQLAGRALS